MCKVSYIIRPTVHTAVQCYRYHTVALESIIFISFLIISIVLRAHRAVASPAVHTQHWSFYALAASLRARHSAVSTSSEMMNVTKREGGRPTPDETIYMAFLYGNAVRVRNRLDSTGQIQAARSRAALL